jgi:hypothetical protein
MKTMFEHEQHDTWLLGRTNLRYCAGTLAKRTEKQTKTAFRQANPSGRSVSVSAKRTYAGGSVMAAHRGAQSHERDAVYYREFCSIEPILSASCAGRAPADKVGGDPVDPRIHLLAKKMDCRVKPGQARP